MSSLIPVKRPDKNGHLVTRYIKDGAQLPSTGSALPAPQPLPAVTSQPDFSTLSSFDYTQAVMDRFREVGATGPRPSIEALVEGLRSNISSYNNGGAAEKLYDMIPELDEDTFQSLSSGTRYMPYSSNVPLHTLNTFAIAVLAHGYSRTVDNALVSNTPDRAEKVNKVMERAMGFFGREGKIRITDAVVGDMESRYLLETLGLNEKCFGTTGDYYRALGRLKEMQDDLTPYLPLLIAMHTAYPDGKRDFYFGDDWYLWDNIDDVMKFPQDRIEAIAVEAVRRGEYDSGLAQEIIDSDGSDILNDGLL